ncbi:MAG: tRNA uridine-5-carboxymethylaminomethyl(34) synthesis GTPase MnmE [Bacillota bacterium]|nr:tRNA uridine-5-carboxymethylaminomethyl(34) synthesis GTPase MnmE [Bacillota bacterium]
MEALENGDLIAALGTPLGEAALGIVRLSGRGAVEIVERIFYPRRTNLKLTEVPSHTIHLGEIRTGDGRVLDEVLVSVMRAPRTYTREDVVEIYCHGGVIPVRSVLDLVLKEGARLAEPGEFTKRAFLSGRVDLAQAEAVLDLIRARSETGRELALKQLGGSVSHTITDLRNKIKSILAEVEAELDFPEDVEPQPKQVRQKKIAALLEKVDHLVRGGQIGRFYREGLATTLVGKPNVGKSTLLNLLLGEERALVTEIPGTTRDLIEEVVLIKGIPLRLIDTAGIREHAGVVERLGIARAREAATRADLVLAVLDAGTGVSDEDRLVLELLQEKRGLVILNKIDLPEKRLTKSDLEPLAGGKPVVEISARFGWGRALLEEKIWEVVGAGVVAGEPVLITRARHQAALKRVRAALQAAGETLAGDWPLDCVAVDLWNAWFALGEITGDTVSEDVIEEIFSEFCIGK